MANREPYKPRFVCAYVIANGSPVTLAEFSSDLDEYFSSYGHVSIWTFPNSGFPKLGLHVATAQSMQIEIFFGGSDSKSPADDE